MRKISNVLIFLFAALPFVYVSQGQAQEPFYKGKTITILAGTGAGNVYDIFARMFARHLGKHIPGNPDIIVQNMPGAASMIAANHLSNVTRPDGLTIGAIFPGSVLRPNHWTSRGKIRLEQVHLARKPGQIGPASLYARRFSL